MSAEETYFRPGDDDAEWSQDESAQPGTPESSENGHISPTYIANISASASRKYVAYTIKLPSEQLAALQSIWLELKRLYGSHSPDKSGMIQQAITEWLKKWDSGDRQELLNQLLEIREDTRRRQYRKIL